MAEHHAIRRNVEDLNVNPSKKTKIEQWKSKKNVKVSKDLEQIEIIKELHEEIKAKNKRKRNNLPTQHQSSVLSPASQDPTPFTINHDKTSSNHEYNFQQEYSFLQKQVPGVENASRHSESTNSYNWGKIRFITIKLSIFEIKEV